LLSGTSYPILWEGNTIFNRAFPSTPDAERMDVAGGYGAVVPNIPNLNGQPYRAAVDVPIQDQIERVYLPVGSIATAGMTTPRDFYGTITGAEFQTGDTYRLEVTVNGNPISAIPVTRNAFGVLLGTPDFSGNARLVVNVIRTRSGGDSTLLTRKVNKGPGPLALDLRVDGTNTFAPIGGLPKGISLVGFPVDPFASLNSIVMGVPEGQLLAARYNSSRARYDLYPELEPFKIGHGYFIRLDAAKPAFSVEGRANANVESSVALKPGWNIVTAPLLQTVPTSRIRTVKASESPVIWSESVGVDVGTEFFQFNPGPADPATGAPETGTMSPATEFEPGKAYFVRVLAPEGVTLSFQPGLPSSPLQGFTAVAPPLSGWRLGLKMRYGRSLQASAVVGQSATATRSFDPREDSGMPPGIGGFQLIVEDYEQMYRDIRPMGGGEAFTLKLQGLTPGRVYAIDFTRQFGTVPSLSLREPGGRNLGTILPGHTFNYYARSATGYIQLVVGGSR
jgi:hypothetical protein